MIDHKVAPAVPDAVADALDRLAISISERGAILEDYSGYIEGLLKGNFDSWRQAYLKLGLPTFSGVRDEWLPFYRAFKETAAYFSESENSRRLYKNLRGPARDFARPLVNAGHSADAILSSLENHFNLFVAVATQLLDKIDQLMLHERSRPTDFVLFATQVDNIVSALTSLSKTHYLHDPRLAMKIMNKVNEHHKESWKAYSAAARDVPILVLVSRFLNEQATKVCSFSHAWVRPPPVNKRPVADGWFDADELWTEARKQLERLPRLTTPATAHQVVLFAAVLKNVVCMVSAKDKWVLSDAQVFYKVLDRLSPEYTWRWYDYAARHRAAAEPELATLAAFMVDAAARVASCASASKHHSLKMKLPVPGPVCLLCRGSHLTPKCRALLRMSIAERLRWARTSGVCVQCLGKHRGRRCRAPRCSAPRCHRPHHVVLHTDSSILS